MHYVWSHFRGPTQRRLTPPSRSETTTSDFWREVYSLFDSAKISEPADLTEFVESLRSIGSDQQDKFDNLPEGLQSSPNSQKIEERATNCSEKADELEEFQAEWEENPTLEFDLSQYEPDCE